MGVCISKGNSKLGEIKSVSLPSGLTCIKCGCNKKCYAKKIERLRPSVRNSYIRNLTMLEEDPQTYWREVEAAIMTSRFFRFHVSGDIPDWDYLIKMVSIAAMNLHCEILCFTKKYELVNHYLGNVGELPPNLHMIFSAWVDLKMVNPFHLPEAHVLYRDGTTTAREDAKKCSGNCTECACISGGCWSLHTGEQVVFNEH